MAGIRAGDQTALARLYDESVGIVYSLALRMTANPADAEEVVSDVYLQVWRGAVSWRAERGSVFAWLTMMCRSRCIDKIRSRASQAKMEVSFAAQRVPAEEPPHSAESQTIRRALSRLDGPEQELLRLAFYSGFTHAELSERLQVPLGTVKTRLRRAIEKLRVSVSKMPA